MNENIADEIRKMIENIKDMKIQASGINNYLSTLEGLLRADIQKKVDEAYKKGYDKGYADKTNNDEVCKKLAKDIQDKAYQRGLEDGKHNGLGEVKMREALEYQRGLDDAWEAAGTISINENVGGLSWKQMRDIFGTDSLSEIYMTFSASEVIEKLKVYEELKAADEIKVGDEVVEIQSGARFCVTHFWVNNHGEKGVSGFNHECSAFQDTFDKVKKTGRHFDIDKILEEMKE